MNRDRQHGATLFMSLIMLVVLTLFVVSAITTSTVNLRVVGNMQSQGEAESAAQLAIEQLIGSGANFNYTSAPASLPADVAVDINNDGTDDYTVSFVKQGCIAEEDFGLSSATIVSDKNTWWEIIAVVNDANATGAVARVHQGVRIPLPSSAVCFCLGNPASLCP